MDMSKIIMCMYRSQHRLEVRKAGGGGSCCTAYPVPSAGTPRQTALSQDGNPIQMKGALHAPGPQYRSSQQSHAFASGSSPSVTNEVYGLVHGLLFWMTTTTLVCWKVLENAAFVGCLEKCIGFN